MFSGGIKNTFSYWFYRHGANKIMPPLLASGWRLSLKDNRSGLENSTFGFQLIPSILRKEGSKQMS